jgi:hypothetical protein
VSLQLGKVYAHIIDEIAQISPKPILFHILENGLSPYATEDRIRLPGGEPATKDFTDPYPCLQEP